MLIFTLMVNWSKHGIDNVYVYEFCKIEITTKRPLTK